MSDNYYEILELTKDSSQEEIEKSYKKLALRYHPDRNPGDSECASKFIKIQQAYDTLKDPVKRRTYDNPAANMPFFSRMNFHEFEDLNIKLVCNLSFNEAVTGTKKLITIHKKSPCSGCDAEGYKRFVACTACNGRGSTTTQFAGMIRFETPCNQCRGIGKIGIEKCNTCNGAKYKVGEETKIDVAIPPGVINGIVLSVNGAGHVGKEGLAGNILVQCLVTEDKKYTLKDSDIYFNFEVDFSTMLFGGKIEIPTFENDLIELEIPEKTQSLTNFRIKGRGMPNLTNKMQRGDLVAVAITKIPTDKEFLPELKKVLQYHGI
jgi:molecular chaperone DnaJ